MGMDLDPRHERAAVLTLAGHDATSVGRDLGVHSTTVGRWLERPDVQTYLATARRAVAARVRAGMAQHVPTAVAVLLEVATDPTAPAAARVKAACAYLDRAGLGVSDDGQDGTSSAPGLTARITVDPSTVAEALMRLRGVDRGVERHPPVITADIPQPSTALATHGPLPPMADGHEAEAETVVLMGQTAGKLGAVGGGE